MARQTRTQAEQDQVNNDFNIFLLPLDASLELGGRTAYGTTDPDINLSYVNVRHLNDSRKFRGTWTAAGLDGATNRYNNNDIVIGSDGRLYEYTGANAGQDPTATGQTDWTLRGGVSVSTTNESTGANISIQEGMADASIIQLVEGSNVSIEESNGMITISAPDVLGAREFSNTDTYEMNNLAYVRATGQLWVYINANSMTGAAAPLPTSGSSNANWSLLGSQSEVEFTAAQQIAGNNADPIITLTQPGFTPKTVQLVGGRHVDVARNVDGDTVTISSTGGATDVPDILNTPSSGILNAYSADRQSLTYTVTADIGAISSDITTTQFASTGNILRANPIVDNAADTVTMSVSSTTAAVPGDTVTIRTQANVDVTQRGTTETFLGTEVEPADFIATVTDNRGMNPPEVTPGEDEDIRVPAIGMQTQDNFIINTHATADNIRSGLAYDVTPSVRVGTGTVTPITTNANGVASFNTPDLAQTTVVEFTFALVAMPREGQVLSSAQADALTQRRTVRVYTPWYWGFSTTQPTGITNLTEGVLVGQSQGDDITAANNGRFDIIGTVGLTTALWIAAPSSFTGNLALHAGIATMEGQRIDNAFTVRNTADTEDISYSLHGFRLGLPASPTTFTLLIS